LSNLGISRWTTLTASLSANVVRAAMVGATPFVEVARIYAAAADPPGLFDARLRYGASAMWMISLGARLRAGAMHDRMGRYGAAAPPSPMAMDMGTMHHAAGSDMASMSAPSSSRCRL
jgi:hypothetical protein